MLYSPRKFTIEPATSKKIDTEVTAFCQKIPGGKLHRNLELMKLMNLFMESTACGSNYETNLLKIISKLKDSLLVSLSLIQTASTFTSQNKGKKGEEKLCRKTRRQTGGFFAYVGRDVVNRAAKVASSIIKGATNEINSIAQQIIDQIISQGGKEIERVLTKRLRSDRGCLSSTI